MSAGSIRNWRLITRSPCGARITSSISRVTATPCSAAMSTAIRPSYSGKSGQVANMITSASVGSMSSRSKYWCIGPLPASYGYTSRVTSAPAALAASTLASD